MSGHGTDIVEVGASVRLVPVPAVAAWFGVSERAVEGFLGQVQSLAGPIKIVNGPNGLRYISLFHLEEAFFNLFEDTLTEPALRTARRELAGVLYGALTQEMIKQRVREIARLIGTRKLKAPTVRMPGDKPRRGRPRKEDTFGPEDVAYCCGDDTSVVGGGVQSPSILGAEDGGGSGNSPVLEQGADVRDPGDQGDIRGTAVHPSDAPV